MSREWSEARLNDLITSEVTESSSIEYKAAGTLGKQNNQIDELTKDISAFANAAGGTLIIGLAEDKSRRVATAIDPIDAKVFSPEWMDQLLNRIRPKIADVRIHAVPINGDSNRVVYVLEIPQGSTAHQATDKRYHKRQNTTILAMEDYEIRDVMGRRTHPEIEADIRIFIEPQLNPRTLPGGRLWWRLRNTANVMARHVYMRIEAPYVVPGRERSGVHFYGFRFLHADNEQYEPAPIVGDDNLACWVLHVSNVNGRPLFPKSELEGNIRFTIHGQTLSEGIFSKENLSYTIFADAMEPRGWVINPEKLVTVEARM